MTSPFISLTADAGTALETLPLRPLPRLGDLEIEAVSVAAVGQCNTVVDVVRLGDDVVGLVVVQCAGTDGAGGVRSLVARSIAEHHLRNGAHPHTVLACVVEEMDQHYPDGLLAGACVAVVDSSENRVHYAAVGGLQPRWYQKSRSLFATQRTLAQTRIQPLGASLEETRIHLDRGDWFVVATAGAGDVIGGGSAPVAGLLRALGRSTPARLAERAEKAARKRQDKGALEADVGLIMVRVPPTSKRFGLLCKLGFTSGEPVHLSSIRYFEEMDGAAARVLKSMDRQGFPDNTIRKMKIALAEMLVNALEHGNQKDPSRLVHLGFVVDAAHAKVSIMDEGQGFKPSRIPDPTKDTNLIRDRGRGIFLARHFVDSLTYNKKGNRVTLVKRFRG